MQKNIHRRANLRKQQKEQYTQVSLCVYAKFYTKRTVYSSEKANAVTSGRKVDNNWA